MNRSKSFRDLIVWKKAHQLVLEIYKITTQLPSEERFGIISQIRRRASSVHANIVEGFARSSKREKRRVYYIANATLEETRYFLILINDLNYINSEILEKQLKEVSKILNSYIKKLELSI
ncbi:MAG: four helix bundle protein [Flavobacteriaceae bacterium]|nr:four helix bundle protein [Flavobacteriaceae bacterium]